MDGDARVTQEAELKRREISLWEIFAAKISLGKRAGSG
jgi:hypothetical protein